MTSVKEQKVNEVVNDPITSVPATNTSETTPSKLERGPDQNLSILPDQTLEGVFDIKIVDIAKDGTHRFLDGVFENQQYFDNQLTRLIDATPKDELRLFIAKKAKYTSSRMEPLGWMPERTKGSEENNYPHNNLMWGPHDPAQFRKLLRCCLGDQHTAFWGRYHFWAEHRALNTHEILFKWMEAPPEHLVGMILFDAEDWTTSNREAFLRWISKHQFVSAIRFGDDTLQTLGKLFLVDFMEFIISNGIAALKGEVDNTRNVEGRMDIDGLPYADPPEYPIDTLSDQIIALLESLKLSTSTKLRPESADSLDRIAEDLVVRLDFMKQCVKRMKDMHYVRLNNYITRSNLRESYAVKRLAVLASIFLPLSLGAGILSMQNRFADIHFILWDFVAVCVDMGLLALIFFQVTGSPKLQLVRYLYQRIISILIQWHLRSQGFEKQNKLRRRLERLTWKVLGLPSLTTIVVALNLGVFGNIQHAWKVLACGLAGGVGLYVLFVMWYMVTVHLLNRYSRRYVPPHSSVSSSIDRVSPSVDGGISIS